MQANAPRKWLRPRGHSEGVCALVTDDRCPRSWGYAHGSDSCGTDRIRAGYMSDGGEKRALRSFMHSICLSLLLADSYELSW